MPFSYALPLLIGKCWLKLQLKISCRQKSAKNPMQKPRKNLVGKNPLKIFYDFLNKKPAKNLKYIQKLPNFTIYN